MIGIEAYGCVTAAGQGRQALWQSLKRGQINERVVTFPWRVTPRNTVYPRACLLDGSAGSFQERLVDGLTTAWQEAKSQKPIDVNSLGVIFCSTKGCMEDFAWNENLTPQEMSQDPYTPVLESFLKRNEISPKRTMCVSNACASSIAGLFLARLWLSQGLVSQVLLLAGDLIGEFTFQGFDLLNAMSASQCRPFSFDRDGLRLGDACVAIVLGGESDILLSGVGLDTEGFAVSRPDTSGGSLLRAFKRLDQEEPDLIVAHGTGTIANDMTEDNAFSQTCQKSFITATKWSLGHTLGASGAVDLIASCEVLKRQDIFGLATTRKIDPSFKGRYITADSDLPKIAWRRILISSLGFGGTHGLALIEKRGV